MTAWKPPQTGSRTSRPSPRSCVRSCYSHFSLVLTRGFSVIVAQIAEMYSRGWNAEELGGLASGNFLRVFAAAEDVAREMAREGVMPAQDLYEKRVDFAQGHWD